MTIRRILAPVTGTDRDAKNSQDARTLATAFLVAERFSAHVQVMFARLNPSEAVPLVGEGMSSSVVDQLMQSAETEWSIRASNARMAFDASVEAAGVTISTTAGEHEKPSAAWHEATGREEEVVARACHLSDLMVAARPADGKQDLQWSLTLEAALINGARPVLLGTGSVPVCIGRRVAIAWRDSADCTRAVAGAMPFLRSAEGVTVITAATGRTHPSRAAELAEFLNWHGIDAEQRQIDVGPEGVGGSLLEACAAVDADLLVMGGYGHSRIREMILGGVTRYVLTHAGLPVLMAH